MAEQEKIGQPDYEARKELYGHLKKGDGFTIDGKPYTFEYLDNPHFPMYLFGSDEAGENNQFAMEDMESGKIQFSSSTQVRRPELRGQSAELAPEIISIIDQTQIDGGDITEMFSICTEAIKDKKLDALPDNKTLQRMTKIVVAANNDSKVANAVGSKLLDIRWIHIEALAQLE